MSVIYSSTTNPLKIVLQIHDSCLTPESGGPLSSARQFSQHPGLSSCGHTTAGVEIISKSSSFSCLSPRLEDLNSWRLKLWTISLYIHVCGQSMWSLLQVAKLLTWQLKALKKNSCSDEISSCSELIWHPQPGHVILLFDTNDLRILTSDKVLWDHDKII